MDTLPLPPRPNLEQYKKRAKDLVKAAKSHDESAVRSWASDWLNALAKSLNLSVTPVVQRGLLDRAISTLEARVREHTMGPRTAHATFTLSDAQFLIARAHGFENWSRFVGHVDRLPAREHPFEAAADAIVAGDLPTLQRLIHQHPELIQARSARVHHASLLHYIAANGVEDFRQKTPANAVAVARYLLELGAEVDALAETYGGGRDQTTMNLLVSSTHPAEARLQSQLVEVLVEFGAAVDGLDDDGSPMMTALAFGYCDAAETLAALGARVDNIVAAAALGRVDLVESFVVGPRMLDPRVPFVSPRWLRMPDSPEAHIELAFVWACKFGRVEVARLLLDRGVNSAATDADRMTALHWAAASGHMDLITLLLGRAAPLEVENVWGGTVLNSTLYFMVNQPIMGADYAATIRRLIAAGADKSVAGRSPSGNALIDKALQDSPDAPTDP